jgi:phenylacetic acid degradation protein/carnitine operon protein CaiE
MAKWKTEGTKIYQALPKQLHETLKECEPLRDVPPNRPTEMIEYETWGKTKRE